MVVLRVEALVDERVLRSRDEISKPNLGSEVSEYAAHDEGVTIAESRPDASVLAV
jgi:hypothetical protein